MKLWLVCFLLLFFGAEALQWLGQVPWLEGVTGSWPMAAVGGVVLAIASNTQSRQPQPSRPIEPAQPPPEAPPAAAVPPASPPPLKPLSPSISFEIPKRK